MQITNIQNNLKIAHERALTPSIIISGFRKTGLFPYDRHIFQDDDFLSSSVTDTDRPMQKVSDETEQDKSPQPVISTDVNQQNVREQHSYANKCVPDKERSAFPSASPEAIRP